MLTRRGFVTCAVCAVGVGFSATNADAQQAGKTSGVTRTILSTTDVPDSNYVVVQVAAEIAPGALVARHTHPGIEAAYVLEGEGTLLIDGQPEQALKGNSSFHVPPTVPHSLRNGGSQPMRLASTYTVEKGKPLAAPA